MAHKVMLGKREIEDAYKTRNLDETAELLGVSVLTLRRRMAEHGIRSHSTRWKPATAIDKDVLVTMYQDHSVPEIAQMFGMDKKTVYARMRDHGIKLRRQGPHRSFSPSREELAELYKGKKMSMRAIAKQYHVGETVVFKRLTEFGLAHSANDRKLSKERNVADKQARLSSSAKAWRRSVLERDGHKCKRCGLAAGLCGHCKQRIFLQTHHIKTTKKHPELRFDVSNGITLCRQCHVNEHKKKIG